MVLNEARKLVRELIASYDMGWRQRRESNSGHGFFFCARTGKIIQVIMMFKKCAVCTQNAQKAGILVNSSLLTTHRGCLRNHHGSSKSMEALACVRGREAIFNMTGTSVYGLVGDDDSSFRANIRHN